MITFVIETAVICVLFTVLCVLGVERGKNNLELVRLDYPTAVVNRLIQDGRLEKRDMPSFFVRIWKKWPSLVLFGVIEGLLVRYINHVETFSMAFLLSYGLWTALNWYDAFVIDCIWFCHSKRVIIPGTEDLRDAYHDYFFHIKGALRGMVIGLISSLIAGVFVLIVR